VPLMQRKKHMCVAILSELVQFKFGMPAGECMWPWSSVLERVSFGSGPSVPVFLLFYQTRQERVQTFKRWITESSST
jgi:hypothetical protein